MAGFETVAELDEACGTLHAAWMQVVEFVKWYGTATGSAPELSGTGPVYLRGRGEVRTFGTLNGGRFDVVMVAGSPAAYLDFGNGVAVAPADAGELLGQMAE